MQLTAQWRSWLNRLSANRKVSSSIQLWYCPWCEHHWSLAKDSVGSMQPHGPPAKCSRNEHCSEVSGDDSMVHTTLTVTCVYVKLYIRPPVIGCYTCVTWGCLSVRIKISIRLKKKRKRADALKVWNVLRAHAHTI